MAGQPARRGACALHKFLVVNGMPYSAYTFFANSATAVASAAGLFLLERRQRAQLRHLCCACLGHPERKLFQFYRGRSECGQTLAFCTL